MNESHAKKECVVTGVAGFVGSHLAERLLAMGHTVVGVDNFFSGRLHNIASFREHPNFSFCRADVREQNLLDRLKRAHPGLKYCFHLAAIVSVPYSMDYPDRTMEINYQATVRLLGEADRLGFTAFIFAGSAAEYGDDQRTPLLEGYATERTRHLSPYGRSKFLASKQVESSLRGASLRFFNIYGPRQDPGSQYSGVISRFTDAAAKGRPLTILGDGQQTRDFVYVADVVDAYILAAGLKGKNGAMPRGIYNIGTGKSTTILELAEAIKRACDNNSGLKFLPERPGDIRHSLAAVDKFRDTAGWEPRVDLPDGLRHTLNFEST